jgi:hypothetical protein
MPNKFIGEVAAPEFGAGFTIRLDMAGQGELESKFGAFDFAHKVQLGLGRDGGGISDGVPESRARNGAILSPGKLAAEIPEFSPLEPVARKCLDAFTLFRYGKDAETWAADNEKKVAEKAPKANPTKGTKA